MFSRFGTTYDSDLGLLYMGHKVGGKGRGGTDCGHLYLQRECYKSNVEVVRRLGNSVYLQLSPHEIVASAF